MNDLRFSAETADNSQHQKFPITPQPVYPKLNHSEILNNISNISTEYSIREESRVLSTKNLCNSENENSADLQNLGKPKPLALKKSSFSFCKNFLLSKNFEEMNINEIGIFSSLRINSKNSNFPNFTLSSDNNDKSNLNAQEEIETKENSKINSNQENINSNFNKKSSLFSAYLKNNENKKKFNNLKALNNFSLYQINNKIENLQTNANQIKNNNNLGNNDENQNNFYSDFQSSGHQIFKSLNIENNKNNLNYNNVQLIYTKNKNPELKLLKQKNFLCNNNNSKKSLFEIKDIYNNQFQYKYYEENFHDAKDFNSDSQIMDKSSNLRKSSFTLINDKNNFNIGSNNSNFHKFNENEREKEMFYNINNITNIYINFENGYNKSNFKTVNPANNNLIGSYLPLISNNNSNNNLNPNKTENNFISRSLNSSPSVNPLNHININKDSNELQKLTNKFFCSNTTGLLGFPISDKFQKETMCRKIFNICDLSICKNRVKKLSNNYFDIFNIELVEPLYKNNFRSLTVEKKNRNSKKFNTEKIEIIQNIESEEAIWQKIEIKINELFNEILDIQKKYLTKASGYISKKQVLNCANFILLINFYIEKLIKLNSQTFKIFEKEASELENIFDDEDDLDIKKKENINFSNIFPKENVILSNNYTHILNNNLSHFKVDNSLNISKLNSKRNKIIINNSENSSNFGASNLMEYDNFSSNLELNDLNQMDITNNFSDHKTEKKRKNSAFIANTEKILQRKISKTSESQSLNNLPLKLQKESFSENSFDADLDKECFSSLENSNSPNNSKSSKALKAKNSLKNVKFTSKCKSSKNESSSLNHENKEIYKCDHCDAFYYTGQALGGHMSRTHPNLSLKYKMKKIVRDRRENQRNVLTEARKELLNKYNLDYEDMKNDKIKKHILKSFIKEHCLEYKEIVKRLKKIKKMHK